ncbi:MULTISPECIES: hypothetical protein [unclassified Enterococcus]|uniref:hypothetical protein n=1 Tax=unclassified Enterococcus TaxID=2608891 RepID=UPI001554B7F4|nr:MULTISPECIES: hypothetical protein [unclassified Enterococcus]MBS7578474.1 hypothetical protein [Enterococcus sp. MMGLQ5-2]MBS7585707.1 hypothetical protein [Enterococcus sp. MMGLQ5-1]NPD13566.1 hypothetical protein [Enterococcus sp. MMGLQ5-1]NPD38308.1 hypothetical protein [Enterococcus sp. MMGLQ5-2]
MSKDLRELKKKRKFWREVEQYQLWHRSCIDYEHTKSKLSEIENEIKKATDGNQ